MICIRTKAWRCEEVLSRETDVPRSRAIALIRLRTWGERKLVCSREMKQEWVVSRLCIECCLRRGVLSLIVCGEQNFRNVVDLVEKVVLRRELPFWDENPGLPHLTPTSPQSRYFKAQAIIAYSSYVPVGVRGVHGMAQRHRLGTAIMYELSETSRLFFLSLI